MNLDDPVSGLDLPTKPRKALLQLGIDTVWSLLNFDIAKVYSLRGFGRTTVREIEHIRSSLAGAIGKHSSVSGERSDSLGSGFVPTTMKGIRQSLPGRARHVLDRLGVATVADLMKLQEKDVLLLRSVGKGTWSDIQRAQRSCSEPIALDHTQITIGDVKHHLDSVFHKVLHELSPRAKKVIQSQNVNSPAAFMMLDEESVLSLPNAGMKTWLELRHVQEMLLQNGSALQCDTIFSEQSARQMPLFADLRLGVRLDIQPSDLHPTFYPQDAVTLLDLPARASNTLAESGICTIGELLCTQRTVLLDTANFGDISLQIIQDAMLLHLQRRNGLVEEPSLDGTSWSSLIKDLLTQCVTHVRRRNIITARAGLLDGQPQTLEGIAHRLNLSRQGVSQIERCAIAELNTNTSKRLLAPLLLFIRETVQSAGGIISYENLASRVAGRHKWHVVPPAGAVRGLLELYSDDFSVEQECVGIDTACRGCDVAYESLTSLLHARHQVSIDEGCAAIHASCAAACNSGISRQVQVSPAFVSDLVNHYQDKEGLVHLSNERLYNHYEWSLRYASLAGKCEAIVEQASGPIHYQQVVEVLAQEHGKSLGPLRVHSYLTSSPSVLMWDRGVFLHHRYAHYDKAFVQGLAEATVARLSASAPFMSVFGIFRECRERAVAAGIPTDRALYSALRREAMESLTCDRYPYIRLAAAESSVKPYQYLEQILEDANEPVPVTEIRRRLCHDLGLRDSHCTQAIAMANNAIRVDGSRLMHVNDVVAPSACLDTLVNHTVALLHRCDHISVVRLFGDRKVTCLGAGILGPRMLYELLARHSGDKLCLSRYPQIRAGGEESTATVHEDIVAFVRDNGRPTSFSDIHDRFVRERGYGTSTISVAVNDDHLVQYYPGCFVHRDTLGLTSAHWEALLRMARASYEESLTAGGYWARLDTALEMHEDGLPPLENGYGWTEDAVRSVLGHHDCIMFVGNARQAYVCIPNKHGIEAFADVCEVLVRDVYGGGCTIAELEEYLVSAGVIRKRLTSAMLGSSPRVSVTEHQICLRELRH